MNRNLVRLGFILFFLSLVTGMISAALKSPRLGLSAHTIAIMSGTILVILGLIDSHLKLGATAKKIMVWSWIWATYGNWIVTLLSAIWGTSGITPIAGAGTTGTQMQETIVFVLLNTVALASFAGVILTIWGLRGREN
jgi:(hydroxyamino)benzene mutase